LKFGILDCLKAAVTAILAIPPFPAERDRFAAIWIVAEMAANFPAEIEGWNLHVFLLPSFAAWR
jgi:hypothetical protein